MYDKNDSNSNLGKAVFDGGAELGETTQTYDGTLKSATKQSPNGNHNDSSYKSPLQQIQSATASCCGCHYAFSAHSEANAIVEGIAAFDALHVGATSMRHKIKPDSSIEVFVSCVAKNGEKSVCSVKLWTSSVSELIAHQSGFGKRINSESKSYPDVVRYKVVPSGIVFTPLNGSVITGVYV